MFPMERAVMMCAGPGGADVGERAEPDDGRQPERTR